jgi:hypothetical protein
MDLAKSLALALIPGMDGEVEVSPLSRLMIKLVCWLLL